MTNSDDTRNDRVAYLYCIKSGPYFKVGVTMNLFQRMKTFAVANPFTMKAIFYRRVPARHLHFVEARIHEALQPWHHRGEWFTAPLPEIKTASRRAIAQIPDREAARRKLVAARVEKHEEKIAREQRAAERRARSEARKLALYGGRAFIVRRPVS